jgi:hypothetical protein
VTQAGWEGGIGRLASLFFFLFLFPFKSKQTQLNSNQDLNPSTQKQCTGMNATVNSYISLINYEK